MVRHGAPQEARPEPTFRLGYRSRRRIAGSLRCVAVVAGLLLVAPADALAVIRSCGLDALANTTTVLCAVGPCSATTVTLGESIDVTTGSCDFDLGGRALVVQKTMQMIGSGFIRMRNAGDITITSTGKLKARGDFVEPNGFIITGGWISLESAGAINDSGVIDVSGDSAGTVIFTAVGDVTLQSTASVLGHGDTLAADGQRFADGGIFTVVSTAGRIMVNGAINVGGSNQATGGTVDLQAARTITIAQAIDATGGGSDGGEVDLTAGDDIIITKKIDVSSVVGGGTGGTMIFLAGQDFLGDVVPGGSLTVNNAALLLVGSDAETTGGDGGDFDAESQGPMRFLGLGSAIRVDAATTFDGSGGFVSLSSGDINFFKVGPSDGDIVMEGSISGGSGNDGGSGGEVDISAGADLTLSGTIDVHGNGDGGIILVDAGGAILQTGAMTAQATNTLGNGGEVDFMAGLGRVAALTVGADILAAGGATNGFGQPIKLSGCSLSVTAGVHIDGHAGVSAAGVLGGSDIELRARTLLNLNAGSRYLAGPGGTITITHPPAQTPVIAGDAVFTPAFIDNATLAGAYSNCPVCGDGIQQIGEGCDDGSLVAGDGCSPTCTVETGWICSGSPSVCGPRCGDGLILAGEQCDDGNLGAGDGCMPTCTVEIGWTCTGQPSACIHSCGDGIIVAGEQCDDGNFVNGDGCDANCLLTTCGNGVVTAGEGCDDGNTQNGDCCSSSCAIEAPGSACASDGNLCSNDVCNSAGTCTHVPNTAPCNDGSACTQTDTCQGGICVGTNPVICTASDQCHVAGTCAPATGTCSNLVRLNGATCSDGNACTRTDTCQVGVCTGANPLVCTALDQCHLAGTCDTGTGVCSNPQKADNITCNDANLCTQSDTCQVGICGGIPVVCAALDQCHVAGICALATGQCSNPTKLDASSCNDGNACTRADVCSAGTCRGDPRICGDGVIEGGCGEVCDDGNLVSGDGCDANCTPTACGNGVVTAGEACDGGDLAAGDGCSSTCAVEAGWGCTGSPSLCREICGDGIKTPGEACDDGNVVARDGCSSTCILELCSAAPVDGCRQPVEARNASLGLKDKPGTAKDSLTWKWAHGAATTHADFGTPLFNTDYAICLYDEKAGTPSLKLSVTAPHAGFCGRRPCWKDSVTGFKYSNSIFVPDGKLKILLKEGLVAGTAKIIVTAKGTNLKMPALPLDQAGRVRVQVKNSNGLCWEADYSTHISNLPDQFKAKSD